MTSTPRSRGQREWRSASGVRSRCSRSLGRVGWPITSPAEPGFAAVHVFEPDSLEVERVFREVSGQAVATLIRVFGDITVAEDAVQDAFVAAAQRWPREGIPPNPAG